MKPLLHLFQFADIYEFVNIIEKHIDDPETFLVIGLEDDTNLVLSLQKPNRLSLLHHYIYRTINVYYRIEYRKNSDLYEKEDARRLVSVFGKHNICLTEYSKSEINLENVDCFYDWFKNNISEFELFWEAVTDEVFHLTFGNRQMLQRFGISLARYIGENRNILMPEITTRKGKIKRLSRLPEWLKRAIYFRDGGRCVFCGSDLSGLLGVDSKINFDHIVPLALLGSNDPSNFQLLCSDCNAEKLDRNVLVGQLYTPWWGQA